MAEVGQNKPLSEFVKAASKAGLKVSCQEKVVSIQGHKLPYNQILVTNGISAKKPGGLLYEVVIQSQFMLPTSIDNIRMQGNRLYQSSLTQCDWDVSRNQSFPEADFKPDPKLG